METFLEYAYWLLLLMAAVLLYAATSVFASWAANRLVDPLDNLLDRLGNLADRFNWQSKDNK